MTQQAAVAIADGAIEQVDIERDELGGFTFEVPADAVRIISVPIPIA